MMKPPPLWAGVEKPVEKLQGASEFYETLYRNMSSSLRRMGREAWRDGGAVDGSEILNQLM